VTKPKASEAHSGRPYKPTVDLDDISSSQECYEDSESKFLFFLGERLQAIPGLEEKPTLNKVRETLLLCINDPTLLSHTTFHSVLETIIPKYTSKHFNLQELSRYKSEPIEYGLVYFLTWMAKYTLKQAYVKDFVKVVLVIYNEYLSGEKQIAILNEEAFKETVSETCQNIDYEFARVLKMNKQDLSGCLKELVNLMCSLLFYALSSWEVGTVFMFDNKLRPYLYLLSSCQVYLMHRRLCDILRPSNMFYINKQWW